MSGTNNGLSACITIANMYKHTLENVSLTNWLWPQLIGTAMKLN